MQPDVLTVREVAIELGISGQRVRQLISAGSLPARRSSAGWLVAADAVAGRDRRGRGRPASPRTAWAVLCMLSSVLEPDAAGLPACVVSDPKLRHRVLKLLSAMPDPADDPRRWRMLLASRGRVEHMWVHPGLLSRLIEDPQVRLGGAAAAPRIGEGLSRTGVHDLYVDEPDARALAARYRLRPDLDGQVTLHIVPVNVPKGLIAASGAFVPAAAGAADLLDADDARARRSAQRQLHAMLKAVIDGNRLRSPSKSATATPDDGSDDTRWPQ